MALLLPAVCATLAFVLASVAVAAAVRKRLPADTLIRNQKPAGGTFMTAIAGIFGVMLAFVLTAAMDRFDRARDVASAELNELLELSSLAEAFPAPVAGGVRRGCRDYFESLAQEAGDRAATARSTQALAGVRRLLLTFKPRDGGETNAQAAALGALGRLGEQRRQRLAMMRQSLPWLVWSVLLFGGAYAVGVSTLVHLEPRSVQLLFVAGLALLIGAAYLTIFVLDKPFSVGFSPWLADQRALIEEALGR